MNLSIEQLSFRWLKLLKIPISAAYLKQKLLSHPEYPSLLSITDTLDELGIENAALVVDKEKLNEIPLPFLAHTSLMGGEFFLVTNLKKHFKDYPDFGKQWDGVVVAAEKLEQLANAENEKWLAKEKRQVQSLWLITGFIILVSAISLSNQFSWEYFGLLVSTLCGLGVAILIVQHELGISNEFTEQLCSTGKNTDCDAVMKSEGSKFLKWFNWADAGIIYFSSIFLFLTISFFSGASQGIINIISFLAVCAIPFTLFSIYYQWRIIKKWCPLCLATVSLLWIQFLLLLPTLLQIHLKNIFINETLFAAFIFIGTTVLWLELLKTSLKRNKELTDNNFSLLRIKNNPEIFKALLQQERRVDTTPLENDLQLGNPDAEIQITVACNPYCGPCAKAHKALHEMVEKNDIGLTIRFLIKTENKEDKKQQLVEYILQLVNDKNREYKGYILHDWYKEMDFNTFSKKYPLLKEVDVKDQLKNHERWNNENKIAFTPTIFINSYELPKQYTAEDLKLVIKNIGKINRVIENSVSKNHYVLAE